MLEDINNPKRIKISDDGNYKIVEKDNDKINHKKRYRIMVTGGLTLTECKKVPLLYKFIVDKTT